MREPRRIPRPASSSTISSTRSSPSEPVRDEEHRPLPGGFEDVPHQGLRVLGVEVCRWLVEHEDGCVDEQRAGEHEALALSAR